MHPQPAEFVDYRDSKLFLASCIKPQEILASAPRTIVGGEPWIHCLTRQPGLRSCGNFPQDAIPLAELLQILVHQKSLHELDRKCAKHNTTLYLDYETPDGPSVGK